jgi:hypothetical protein
MMKYPETEENKAKRERILSWNKHIEDLVASLKNVLSTRFENGSSIQLIPESFIKPTEQIDLEYIKPRNYLSYEKIIVKKEGQTKVLYFGNANSLGDFKQELYLTCEKLLT